MTEYCRRPQNNHSGELHIASQTKVRHPTAQHHGHLKPKKRKPRGHRGWRQDGGPVQAFKGWSAFGPQKKSSPRRTRHFWCGDGGGSGVYPGNSNWVKGPEGNAGSFQGWGKRRGDLARAILYMAIRYEGGRDVVTNQSEPDLELTDDRSKIVVTSASPAYMGLMSTLLAWHSADPPDAAERGRNEVIFSFQGNRNPFIDHPEWATAPLFTSVTPATCVLN